MRNGIGESVLTRSGYLAAAVTAALMAVPAEPAHAADAPATARKAEALEEVVVTARRRVESRQDVPLSVAAVTGEQIEAHGVRQVVDLTNKLPNFLMQTGTLAGYTTVTVRGIDASVRNAGFKPSVSFYVDGIYQGRPANFNQDLVDLERVELLLGPQGTLFGNNTIAGVVNLVTRRPTNDVEGFATLSLGNYRLKDFRGSVNVPINEVWALRASGAIADRDGFQNNLFTGRAQGDLHRGSGRVQLLGRLAATDVLVIADYQRVNERPQAVEYTRSATAAGVPNFVGQPYTIAQDPSRSEIERKGLAVKIDHRFQDGGTLSSVTSWKRTGADERFDQDYSADPRISSNIFNDESERLIAQEFRFESNQAAPFRYTVGAFYLDDRVRLDRDYDYPPPLILLGGLGALHFNIPTLSVMDSKSYAAFGNAEYDLLSKLTVGAGIRFSKDDQDVRWSQSELLLAQGGVTSAALARQIFGPSRSGLLVANAPLYTDTRTDNSVSGTATVSWNFDSERRAYLRYARGTKSGGFNLEPLPDPLPPTRAFGPEKLDAYELGFKSQWADRRLLANVAVFFQNYSDLQRADVIPLQPAGQTRIIRNAGKVEVKGAEVELAAVIVSGLTARATYGYAQAKYKSYVLNNGTDLKGQPLGGVPRWNATAGLTYTHPVSAGWSLVGDGSIDLRGRRLLGPSDATSVTVDGYNVLDARLGLVSSDGAWELALTGRNLGQSRYVTVRSGGNDFYARGEAVAYGEPRMWGFNVRRNFGSR
jgi:iron complex outermembrane receptor protein